MRHTLALLLAVPLALSGCDGGGNGSGGGLIGTPGTPPGSTPTPTPSPTPVPTPSPTATPPPSSADWFTRAAFMYSAQPDIGACQTGVLKPEVKAEALAVLNTIRAEHNLPPTVYSNNPADDQAVMDASLMMAANSQLSHTPPASWRCYTAAGSAGAASSNLFGGFSPFLVFLTTEEIFAGWMTDVNNLVADSVGHRRWLLDPFLGAVAYGRVAARGGTNSRQDAATVRVFNAAGSPPPAGTLPAFVAYPFEDYPARFYDGRALMSFGVISNPNNRFANTNVNFASATISVRERGGGALAVSNIAYDTQGFGLPNNLQWFAAGVQPGVIYDVTIANVLVGGASRTYSYFFRITP